MKELSGGCNCPTADIEKAPVACVGVEMSLEVVDNEQKCFEMCSEDVLSMV